MPRFRRPASPSKAFRLPGDREPLGIDRASRAGDSYSDFLLDRPLCPSSSPTNRRASYEAPPAVVGSIARSRGVRSKPLRCTAIRRQVLTGAPRPFASSISHGRTPCGRCEPCAAEHQIGREMRLRPSKRPGVGWGWGENEPPGRRSMSSSSRAAFRKTLLLPRHGSRASSVFSGLL
jgi:hypothetical protein